MSSNQTNKHDWGENVRQFVIFFRLEKFDLGYLINRKKAVEISEIILSSRRGAPCPPDSYPQTRSLFCRFGAQMQSPTQKFTRTPRFLKVRTNYKAGGFLFLGVFLDENARRFRAMPCDTAFDFHEHMVGLRIGCVLRSSQATPIRKTTNRPD